MFFCASMNAFIFVYATSQAQAVRSSSSLYDMLIVRRKSISQPAAEDLIERKRGE